MFIYSFRHIGGPLNGTVVDVTVGSEGRRRFEIRKLYVGRSGCDAGTGGLAPATPR